MQRQVWGISSPAFSVVYLVLMQMPAFSPPPLPQGAWAQLASIQEQSVFYLYQQQPCWLRVTQNPTVGAHSSPLLGGQCQVCQCVPSYIHGVISGHTIPWLRGEGQCLLYCGTDQAGFMLAGVRGLSVTGQRWHILWRAGTALPGSWKSICLVGLQCLCEEARGAGVRVTAKQVG